MHICITQPITRHIAIKLRQTHCDVILTIQRVADGTTSARRERTNSEVEARLSNVQSGTCISGAGTRGGGVPPKFGHLLHCSLNIFVLLLSLPPVVNSSRARLKRSQV